MKALICLILLVFCLGCSENETTITAPVIAHPDCHHVDSIVILNEKVKHWQHQHNAYQKMVQCYADWFRDNGIERPDCHANY
jgi:hypothetical protein